MHRRNFIKNLGVLGSASLSLGTGQSAEQTGDTRTIGVLVDTTRCLGCRACERSCARAHDLPSPDFEGNTTFDHPRMLTETQWTAVNRHETEAGKFFVKRQCMHCTEPACVAACPTRAMYKTDRGPVIWREDKCLGCRYCMISCPFDVPKFEYGSATPRIQKCILCWDRMQQGDIPACVKGCPGKALIYGNRNDLLDTAKARIYKEPDKYHHQVYGEHEVHGTGWLYISTVPFEQIGFRTDLGTTAFPEYTKQFLYSVPVVLLLWPAMMLALNKATEKD